MLRFLELYEAAQSKRRAFILAQAYAKRGESERAMSFRQHKLEGLNESLAGLTKVTNDISTIDPFLAFDLQRRISGLSLVLEGIMSGIEGNDAVLQELEQAMRVSFATELETCIVKVAWRKGVISSLKALWHLRKEKYRAEHESSNADQVVSLMQMLKTGQRVGVKGKAEDAID